MNWPPNDTPETQEIRVAIKNAINDHLDVVIRYGRGSSPGTIRTIQPTLFLDEDMFEGIQISPEPRQFTQKYRTSCILELHLDGRLIDNPSAKEKCRSLVEYFERSKRLTEQIKAIESRSWHQLPASVIPIGGELYLWNYRPALPSVLLKAPSRQNMAAFVTLANAVAIEDWGGRSWVIIDAMLKYHIDWPGWYLYAKHLEFKLEEFAKNGKKLDEADWEFPIPEIDWPGFDFLNPSLLSSHQKSVGLLYASLHRVPVELMLAYIHDVRPQDQQYAYSRLLDNNFTNESMILQLYVHDLADGSLQTIIDTTSIQPMREVLAKAQIQLPETKNRREPHIELIVRHAHLKKEFEQGLWPYRRSIFLKAPNPLTWEELHDLRAQIILMGKLLYAYLLNGTGEMPIASGVLSGRKIDQSL